MSETVAENGIAPMITPNSQEQKIQDLEIAMMRVGDQLTELHTAVKTVDVILSQLTNRVLQIEGNYFNLRNSLVTENRLSGEHAHLQTDEAMRKLDKKVVANGKPNATYFNTRFRDYEIAIRNIRNLAAHRGAAVLQEHRHAKITGPKVTPLKAKGCTEEDIESEWVAFWCNEIRIPVSYHRKTWELAYVAQI